jgi:hypothetical protein
MYEILIKIYKKLYRFNSPEDYGLKEDFITEEEIDEDLYYPNYKKEDFKY